MLLRIIAIQSSPDEDQKDKNATLTLQDSSSQDNGVNLFILAGHEAMQLWLVNCDKIDIDHWSLMKLYNLNPFLQFSDRKSIVTFFYNQIGARRDKNYNALKTCLCAFSKS